MGEFGHFASIGSGICIDYWGAGPFVIEARDRSFRFEDSDRFGPATIKKNGDPTTRQPAERSPFWPAHRAWKEQGRRLADDGRTCIYDPLRPTLYRRIRGRNVEVVEEGDEGGDWIEISVERQNAATAADDGN